MQTAKLPSNAISVVIVVQICLSIFQLPAIAQVPVRLTFNAAADISPVWDPRGGSIAYIRPKSVGGSVFDAYSVLTSSQGGEQPILTGLNSDFGVAVELSWIGSSGFLAVAEAISGFEILSFNTALAPFNRTVANGADAASSLLLSIDGLGGGGLLRISRDGNSALTRFSSRGSFGAISIRFGAVSAMAGQAASQFGNALISLTSGDTPYLNGGSLSADGSRFVLAIPIGTSSSAHDLEIGSTAGGARTNITNSASSGISNINPDFSPDGTKIVFARRTSASALYDLYTINTDGTGLTQVTNTPNFNEMSPSWSPDGASVAYMGIHTAGFESDAPALLSGESANYNIYLLTLPPANIVTPKTVLTEPPLVQIDGRKVTFTLTPFTKAQKTAVAKSLFLDNKTVSAAKGGKAKFSFKYDLRVTKTDSKKKTRFDRISSRNIVTYKNLPPGSYTSMYRVIVSKKMGSNTSVAGKTKFSPRATFMVN